MSKRVSIHRILRAAFLLMLSSMANADVRIGAPFALSGSVAALAEDMRLGVALAAEQVNAQGGVMGEPFVVIYKDSACDPDTAVQVVSSLIEEDQVSALVGPVCSGATLRQAQSVSIPSGVVTLSVASASHLISNLRDSDLVFRTALSDAYKGEVMAAYLIDQDIKDVSVSFSSDAYNTSVAKVFSDAFRKQGGKIAVSQAHQPEKSNYQREASALLAGSRNLALFAYYGSSGTQLLKDVIATGEVNHVFGSDGLLSQDLIDQLGAEALKNTRILTTATDETRKAFKMWQSFADSAGIPASGPYVANSYDAAFMMALAIEAVQSASREDISRGLRLISGPEGELIYPGEFDKAKKILSAGGKINYEGGSGVVDFDNNGDVTGFVSMSLVSDGQWTSELLTQ